MARWVLGVVQREYPSFLSRFILVKLIHALLAQEIVQNINEKVALLKEESSNLKQSLVQKTERIDAMEEEVYSPFF